MRFETGGAAIAGRLRMLAPLVVCLCLVGCRPDGSGAAGGTGLRVGPSLESLTHHLRDPKAPLAEREAYLRRASGKLISGSGRVAEIRGGTVLIECSLEPPAAETVFLQALPGGGAAALASVRPGQKLGAQGVLAGADGPPERLGARQAPFVLNDARLRAR